jgi:hypothetical protein
MGAGQVFTTQETEQLARLPNIALEGTVRSNAKFVRTSERFLSLDCTAIILNAYLPR